MSGESMTEDDLLPLKVGKPVKPRHSPAMSIPGILGMLHNEWDALMLDTHELRQQLQSARQELSYALYQHDAACRVIARLMREKEAAQRSVEDLKAQVASVQQQAALARRPDAPDDDEPGAKRARAAGGPSADMVAALEGKAKELFEARKNRVAAPAGLADKENVAEFALASTEPLHSTAAGGLHAIALSPSAPNEPPKLVATAGGDHSVQIFNAAEDRVAASLSGHSKKVTTVAFAGPDAVVSGSADKSVRVWAAASDGAWASRTTLDGLTDSVVRVFAHPLHRYVFALAANSCWQMHDLEAGECVFDVDDAEAGGYRCGALHPDGAFFGAGTNDGALRIFDIKSGGKLMELSQGLQGAVEDVAFNENGYWAAIACASGVQVWDLRKPKMAVEIAPFEDSPAKCLAWDHSGKYLACGGPSVKVYDVAAKGKKKGVEAHVLKSLVDLPAKGAYSVAFGALAHTLYVGSSDHNLRKFTC